MPITASAPIPLYVLRAPCVAITPKPASKSAPTMHGSKAKPAVLDINASPVHVFRAPHAPATEADVTTAISSHASTARKSQQTAAAKTASCAMAMPSAKPTSAMTATNSAQIIKRFKHAKIMLTPPRHVPATNTVMVPKAASLPCATKAKNGATKITLKNAPTMHGSSINHAAPTRCATVPPTNASMSFVKQAKSDAMAIP